MEVKTEVGVNANAEVVVHHKDGRCILVGLSRVGVVCQSHLHLISLFLVRVKDHGPPDTTTKQYRQPFHDRMPVLQK